MARQTARRKDGWQANLLCLSSETATVIMQNRETQHPAYRAPSQSTRRFHALPVSVHTLVAETAGAILFETSRRSDADIRSYLFLNPVRVFRVETPDELPELFRAIDSASSEGLYAAGYLGYECGYHFEPAALATTERVGDPSTPVAWFGFYRDPIIFDHASGEFNRDLPLPDLPAGNAFALEAVPQLEISAEIYLKQVQRVKQLIERGDTYQVSLTTRLLLAAPENAAAMFTHMMASQPVEFGAFLNLGPMQILSASPELFFRRDGDRIEVRPMKGTVRRGRTTEEDVQHARWLRADEKNRSENVMIVDLLRNDLGRICKAGSVKVEDLFTIERYPTVLQMISTVRGVLRDPISDYDLFRALFPSGSIVGAPKIRTMQIVREIERRSRGVYTGSIGFIAPDRKATFSVAIRTVVLQNGMAEMGVGSGIVYDSDPLAEYDECRSKAGFLANSTIDMQLIETMLWDSRYEFLEEHLARLAASAEYFDYRLDLDRVRSALDREAAKFQTGERWRVRLLLGANASSEVTARMLTEEQELVDVVIAAQPTSSDDVFLRHKTTRRKVYDEAHALARSRGFADAIFRNERAEITEGAIHNIIVVKGGAWKTPPLSSGVLPGIFRDLLIRRGEVLEEVINADDLFGADEVYLCNSVRGLRRARKIERA